ncbi:MAG: SHOCT domain-containing protein [Actinomycetes bacterium]
MKTWITGLVLVAVGLLLVPASYFAIILNDLSEPVKLVLFGAWFFGFLAVPVGLLLILISAVRSGRAKDQNTASAVPDSTGLVLILIGLLVVPTAYFAITLNTLVLPVEVILLLILGIGFLAVPVGFVMLIVSGVQNGNLPIAPPDDEKPSQAATENLGKLDDLREAGVITDAEYHAKKAKLLAQ